MPTYDPRQENCRKREKNLCEQVFADISLFVASLFPRRSASSMLCLIHAYFSLS